MFSQDLSKNRASEGITFKWQSWYMSKSGFLFGLPQNFWSAKQQFTSIYYHLRASPASDAESGKSACGAMDPAMCIPYPQSILRQKKVWQHERVGEKEYTKCTIFMSHKKKKWKKKVTSQNFLECPLWCSSCGCFSVSLSLLASQKIKKKIRRLNCMDGCPSILRPV